MLWPETLARMGDVEHGPAILRPTPPGAADIACIDTHCHVFTRALKMAEGRRYTPAYDATIDDHLCMLDENGVTYGVLVQPSFLGVDNGYLLQALRRAPDRLRGIVVVAPDVGAEELRALDRLGVVGVRLNLIGLSDPPLDSPVWQGHLRRVAELGWLVEVHAEARRLPHLLPALLSAGVRVLIDHFGRPDPVLGVDDPGFRYLLALGATKQVWVKLSGAYRNGAAELGERVAATAAVSLIRAFGPARLVWGSDWPHTGFERLISPGAALCALGDWVPDPAARRAVLVATPARLFRFTPASVHVSGGSERPVVHEP